MPAGPPPTMQHRVFIVRRDGCFGELPASMIRLSLIGRSTPETLDLGDAAVAIGQFHRHELGCRGHVERRLSAKLVSIDRPVPLTQIAPDDAEPVIGRALLQPVGIAEAIRPVRKRGAVKALRTPDSIFRPRICRHNIAISRQVSAGVVFRSQFMTAAPPTSSLRKYPQATVTRKPDHRGEHEGNR
jgi:hypothetical protein